MMELKRPLYTHKGIVFPKDKIAVKNIGNKDCGSQLKSVRCSSYKIGVSLILYSHLQRSI